MLSTILALVFGLFITLEGIMLAAEEYAVGHEGVGVLGKIVALKQSTCSDVIGRGVASKIVYYPCYTAEVAFTDARGKTQTWIPPTSWKSGQVHVGQLFRMRYMRGETETQYRCIIDDSDKWWVGLTLSLLGVILARYGLQEYLKIARNVAE